jgi:hypothetical protein
MNAQTEKRAERLLVTIFSVGIGTFASAFISWMLWKDIGLAIIVGLLVGAFVLIVDVLAKHGVSTRFVKADDEINEENERIEKDFFDTAKRALKEKGSPPSSKS